MSKKEKKIVVEEPVHLDIPEDEIWTYQVEGLAAPHINKPYKHYGLKKVIFALVIIVAVSISCYFSVRTVQKDTFEYEQTQSGYELSKFSNTGYMTTLDIDFVSSVEYDRENPDVNTNFKIVKDETKKVTSVGSYALNCDEKVKIINIGADVGYVDPKAFYSCWALQQIEVDENNPNYCDVDGVLYSKDMTEIICRPCDHDTYLAEKYGHAKYDENGFRIEPSAEDENYEQYVNDVMTFVVPSSVETVGQLCFNYANMKNVYLPEGLKTIETLGFFEIPLLENVYSYKASTAITDSHFVSESELGKVYNSLPEGLEYIGSDAFSYNQAMLYVFIPESVTYIGHHAFWDTVYKEGDTLKGVTQINVAASEEDFKENVETGDSWRPQYDYMLFKKSIDVVYSSTRA
ncbi:MAG: leucine-rich repeat protein [Clostridia bacterium]|nr:leucine-rich repeat protein [Clostridia bacterium]